MSTTNSTRYTVIVKDGEVVDRNLRLIAPSIRTSCGHNHRTREAAERCQEHLRNRHREATGSWVESAIWYNSQIHEHADDSMDYLPPVHWLHDPRTGDHQMSTARTWTDPYRASFEAERTYAEYVTGVQDGEYCKAWQGFCPRYPEKRTSSYRQGFKAAAGFTPEEWDRQ